MAQSNSHSNSLPMVGRLSLFFPVPAKQNNGGEYITLRELEFEKLESPDSGGGSATDEKFPEYYMRELGEEQSGPLLQ